MQSPGVGTRSGEGGLGRVKSDWSSTQSLPSLAASVSGVRLSASDAPQRLATSPGLPMTKLHTGWFGASALVINDEVVTEAGDVLVSSSKCEAVVLDAAGCDTLASMIERKDIKVGSA